MRLFFVVMLGVLTGCSTNRVRSVECGPQTCSGCCSADGVCLSGATTVACGERGVNCSSCEDAGDCVQGACSGAPVEVADAGPVLGDDCQSPLHFAPGAAASQLIRFSGLSRQSARACGAPSADAVVQLEAPGAGRLVLELSPGAADQSVAVEVTDTCAAASASTRCATDRAGSTVVLVEDFALAGARFVWVSASTSAPVRVQTRWVPLEDGASCAQPLALALAHGSGAAFLPSGPLVGPVSCGPAAAGGLALALGLTESNRLALQLEADGGASLDLAAGSCSGSSAGCASQSAGTVALEVGEVVAGTLSARLASAGQSVLRWNLRASGPGESCFDRVELGQVDAVSPVVVTGTLAGAFDDVATECVGMGSPDRVYAFETATEQTTRLTLTTDGGAVMAVSSDFCGLSWAPCSAGGSLILPSLPRGQHFVAVEGSGDFELRIEAVALLSGDSCRAPFVATLPDDGGVLAFSGDLTGALDDAALWCSGSQPDQAYRVGSRYGANMKVTASRPDGGPLALGAERSTCTPSPTWCRSAEASRTTLNVEALVPSNTVWVEGSEGPYTLELRGFATRPGGDCAHMLDVPVVADGGRLSLEWGTDDAPMGNSLDSCGTSGADDAFFRLTNDGGVLSDVTVRVVADGGDVGFFSAGVACSQTIFTCTPGSGKVRLAAGGVAPLMVEGLPTQGTNTLIVDSKPVPPGDACELAFPLVADAGTGTAWTLITTGDLSDAGADRSCYCAQPGADQFFQLNYPQTTTQVRVTVRPLAPFVPRLSFTYTCGTFPNCLSPPANSVCPAASNAGQPVSFVFTPVFFSGGNATLVVSSGGGTPGPYELTVTNQ